MKKQEFLNKLKSEELVNESASVASVLGDPGSPTYGGFIGPLSRISKKKLYSRLFHTWKDGSVKNGSGVGRIAIPPQGYVKEHIYSVEGKMVTEGDLKDWFGADLNQKPSFNGGKLVAIEPKCLAFPYCSQGAIDKPIKLIGETKEHMCEGCYDYCSHIANETGKKPEQIAKMIREKYLAESLDGSLDEGSNMHKLISFEEVEYQGRYFNFDAYIGYNVYPDDIDYRVYKLQDVEVYDETTGEYVPFDEEKYGSDVESGLIDIIRINGNYTEYIKDEINDDLNEDLNKDIVVDSLDESIELKFNKEIIIENIENKQTMENIKMTPEIASKCMNEIMANKDLAECMYETLVSEGFLPDTLEEGDTYESQCRSMMEDAEICMEMMKSCQMSEGECATKVNEGIMSFLYGDPLAEFKEFLEKTGKDKSLADAIANEDDMKVKEAMFLSAIDGDEANFVGRVGSRAKDMKHALGLIDAETRDASRVVGKMHKAVNEDSGKYAKIEASVQNNGARKTAVKLVDAFIGRMLGGMGSSDLADTATFANGLDTIEELLEDGDYEGAVIEAKETAQAMLEDEGMDMFEGKMEEGEGINPAIYDQLKHCVEHGHTYEQAKEHVADAVDGWDLSKEDYEEAKKKFGKANEGMELEEGGEGSRYMFFSNLEQIKNQAEQLLALDHDRIEAMLNSGHDWAADHVATAKETLDHAFDFITNDIMGKDQPEMPAMTAPLQGPIGVDGPDGAPGVDGIMEFDDSDEDFDDEGNTTDHYNREMKYFTQYMNMIEKSTTTLAKALSSEDIKNKFNEYYGGFEASKQYTADDFINFLSKGAEEDYIAYADRLFSRGGLQSIFMTMISPTKQDFLNKTGLANDDSLMMALDKVLELQTKIIKKLEFLKDYKDNRDARQTKDNDDSDFADEKEPTFADIKKMEKMPVDFEDDDDFLEEAELPNFNPIKGKNVDSENKSASEKENGEAVKGSEDSQETTEEKVDNLKNQKHINSDREGEIELKQHGRNSMLDLDYGNDSNEDFKDRIEDQADGLAPEDHANVDHESEGGEKLMKAVKARRPERDMDYGSKGLNIDKEFAYERSDALNEAVDSELERMKKMFTYDQAIINEEKKVKQINENEIFLNSVSKKKLL